MTFNYEIVFKFSIGNFNRVGFCTGNYDIQFTDESRLLVESRRNL